MTFHEFVEAVFASMNAHPEWRQGQALFNVYAEHSPVLAENLRVSPFNPFYDDENVAEAWDWIGQNWDTV